MNEKEKLVEEIKQIITQYQSEVGRGRKAWPKSIRTRVEELFGLGLRGNAIASLTGLPYFTVLKMRPEKVKAAKPVEAARKASFHRLEVASKKSHEIATVTATNLESKKTVTVTVTTPDGYQIQAPSDFVFSLLSALRQERN